jgi:hypothetical protein
VDYQNKYIYIGILFCLTTLVILHSSLCHVTSGWAVVLSVPACYEWDPHILVLCFAVNTMFLLAILKDVGNYFLRPVDTSYHSHTRSLLWNLKLCILNAFFHIFSVRILCIHFILQHSLQTKLVWVHLWQMKRPQSCYYSACSTCKFPLQRFKSGEHKGHNLYPPSLLLLLLFCHQK